MRHKFSKEEQIVGGKISGTRSAELKIGIHAISPKQHRENSARGGRKQGPIQGRQNVATGQLDRIRNLPQTKAAQSAAGKITGKRMGLIQGPLNDMDKIRTVEGCKKGAVIGGPIGRHVRHHINRGRKFWKPEWCVYCAEAIQKELESVGN